MAAVAAPPILLKAVLVGAGLGLWFLTQSLLRYRPDGTGVLGDGLHTLTARFNRFLNAQPHWANRLLVASSLGIDLLGCFVLVLCVFGPSVGPFVGLMMLFFSRQVCQALCALPPPEGMIWRATGVPTLLVTYGTANDLFFSGHTALAIYGAILLGLWGGPWWAAVGVALALFEVAAVIVLRAHYTMDVFTGALAAFAAAIFADWSAPTCDRWLTSLGQALGLT
ncbi:MAG TPA: phosphatase PAP2-related protein [Gemmatales bacterium]|nr:phosphatase PAP2-related protein [Gemmatales bacterium]